MSNHNKIGHFDGIVLGSNTTNQVLYTTYQTEITITSGTTGTDTIENNKGAFLPIAVGIHVLADGSPSSDKTIDIGYSNNTSAFFDNIIINKDFVGFSGLYRAQNDYSSGSDTNIAVTLTPAATSGASVNFTRGSGNWSSTDVGKIILNKSSGEAGVAKILSISSTVATAKITTNFTNTDDISSGDWSLISDNGEALPSNTASDQIIVTLSASDTIKLRLTFIGFYMSDT